jgi:hypothetical protein
METTLTLRVLIFKEDAYWLARCLDHDIVGRGANITSAIETLVMSLAMHVTMDVRDQRPPLEGLLKAPDYVWEAFEKAFEVGSRSLSSFAEVPEELRSSMPEPWQIAGQKALDLRIAS